MGRLAQLEMIALYVTLCCAAGAISALVLRRWGTRGLRAWWLSATALFVLAGYASVGDAPDVPGWLTVGGVAAATSLVVFLGAFLEKKRVSMAKILLASGVGGIAGIYAIAVAGYLLWILVASLAA